MTPDAAQRPGESADRKGLPDPQTGHGTGYDVPREVSEASADTRGVEWVDNLGRSQAGPAADPAAASAAAAGVDPPAADD